MSKTYRQIVQLENDLREYIAQQVKRLDDVIPEHHNVQVAYNHNDSNGMWNVWGGGNFDVKAAMLSVAVDEALDRLARADRLKELPRLLVAPSVHVGVAAARAPHSDDAEEIKF